MKKMNYLSLFILGVIIIISPRYAMAAETGYSTASAINITFGEEYTKTWTKSNYGYDCYNVFTVPETGRILFFITKPIDSTGEYGSLSFYVYDSNGMEIQEISTYNFNKVSSTYEWEIGLSAGTYYVNIDAGFYVSSGSITSTYTVSYESTQYVEIEPNSGVTKATDVKYESFYVGFIHLKDDNDYYRFYSEEDGYIYLHIDNYEELDESTGIVQAINSNGTTLHLYSSSLLGIYGEIYVFAVEVTEGYNYIRVYNENTPVSYRLMVSKDFGELTIGGNCGSSTKWNLSADGTLTISGTGAMNSYSYGDAPWYTYRDYITSIVIESGVTSIGEYVFYYCENVTSVIIPASVTFVGKYAFNHCKSLTTITFEGDAPEIANYAFQSVTATVYYPDPNSTWDSVTDLNYGGTLIWIGEFMAGSKMAISSATNLSAGVKLSWNKVSSATGYKIYRRVGSGSYSLIKTVNSNDTVTYTDTDVSSGTSYTYYIEAYNSSVTSTYTTKPIVYLAACSVKYINNTMDGFKVAYYEVTGASGYYIYIRNDDGTYDMSSPDGVVTDGSTTEWIDPQELVGAKDYTYKVAAYYKSSDGTITLGPSGATKTCKYLKGGEVESVENTSSGLKVTWTKVAGANGYYIFRKAAGEDDYTQVATVTGSSKVSWTDTSSLTSGKNYTYKVSAIFTNSKGQVTKGGAKTTKTAKYLTAGKISSLSNTANGVYIKWSKVTGATGYYVYRKTSSASSYTLVKTITSVGTTTYSDTAVKSNNNTTYTYYIQPYFKSSSGAITKAAYTTKTIVRLVAPTISSLTNSASKTLTVKWGTKSGVTGYQVQYSANSSFSSGNKTLTVTGASSSSKVISSLTKGKTYYVRIRTYKTVNGTTYYSAWCTVKSVKISK